MTNQEFKKKIAEAADPKWFASIAVTFNFAHVSVNLKLVGRV